MDPYQLPTQKYEVPEPLSVEDEARIEAALLECWDQIDPERKNPDDNAEKVALLMVERYPVLYEQIQAQIAWKGLCMHIEEMFGEDLIDGPPED